MSTELKHNRGRFYNLKNFILILVVTLGAAITWIFVIVDDISAADFRPSVEEIHYMISQRGDWEEVSENITIALQGQFDIDRFTKDKLNPSRESLGSVTVKGTFKRHESTSLPHRALSLKPTPVWSSEQFRGGIASLRVSLIEQKGLDPGSLEFSPIIRSGREKGQQVSTSVNEFFDERPRIAVVLCRLGYSQSATRAAIQQLPGAVTLGFVPYAPNLADWMSQARAAGHEVLLQIPMESNSYPTTRLGPHALLTTLSTAENLVRLEWLLSRGSGYVGVINVLGSRFISSSVHVRPILTELKLRGLLYLDASTVRSNILQEVATELGLPNTAINSFLDTKASRGSIDARLYELEHIAMHFGSAVGLGAPYPVTIERIAAWASTLESKGLVLVPISALVNDETN
tara:strand:- start:606 stop:1814 length:1209 start_codon:yes stop_codon:yes gene_type:complete